MSVDVSLHQVPLVQHYFRRMLTTLCTLLLLAVTLLVVVYLQIFSRYYTERENGAVCDAFGARQGVSQGCSTVLCSALHTFDFDRRRCIIVV